MKEIAMTLHIILLLICLIFNNVYANEKCDNDACLETCKYAHLNGTCNAAGNCQCSFGHTCSTMLNTCEAACKILHMDGECDENDQCQCSATPEWCNPTECQQSCRDDPRSQGCVVVEAVGCIEYGPVTFCQCVCYQWSKFGRKPSKQWSTSRKSATPKKCEHEVLKV